jgi:hypothetical protein
MGDEHASGLGGIESKKPGATEATPGSGPHRKMKD